MVLTQPRPVKLTREDVHFIRQQNENGVSQAALAAVYGVHPSLISRIVNRKKWRNV